MNESKWTENVILADADYVDRVAFDLTVNFERMLGRQVPPADLAQWVECVALDGGMKEGEHETLVVLVHDRQHDRMQNFAPGSYQDELSGQAFRGRLGEFTFTPVQTEDMAGKEDLLLDTLQLVCAQPEVKRLMLVVPDELMDDVRPLLRRLDSDDRRTTLFSMQPTAAGACRHELLGFSLMAALGITSQEIDAKIARQ